MDKSPWALIALDGIDGMAAAVGRASHVDVVAVQGMAARAVGNMATGRGVRS
jgi:hypothetical protein